MKKIIIILLAVMVMISSVSLAEDLSSLSDADLLVLYRQASLELESRNIDPEAVYPKDDFSGSDLWRKEMADRLELFFGFWNASDISSMLTVCSSGWKADRENPGIDLFALLGNRTPEDFEILSVSREPGDFVRNVALVAGIDKNDGKDPAKYILRIAMTLEEDGLWYVDPGSLDTFEYAADGPRAETVSGPGEEAGETPDNTVLYYVPAGGQYYHTDRNCITVNERYLPMKGTVIYADLNDEAYQDLQPCSVCGAPARPENEHRAGRFRDVVDAAGETAFVGEDIDYLAAVTVKDGKYIRTVTLLDDHAKELYMTFLQTADSGETYEAFKAYAWSLPVSYTEEITAEPKGRAELDALAGKTVGELMEEGYSFYGIGGGENLPTVVDLSYGMFLYEFEVDAPFEQYLEHGDWDGLENMKIKGGKLLGFFSLAANLDWLADGTYEPQFVPNITAEEAAAARQLPPPEEYTAKAWPLTAEGYADLLNNTESRYGQVYMIKGAVHQVLSKDPLRVIINTGEDGKSQPVIVEYPQQPGSGLEAGGYYRIYADVASSCYILPVLTARYTFSGQVEEPADEPATLAEDAFTAPNVIRANGIEDFLGEWHCFRIMNGDGSEMSRKEMLAEGLVDDHAEIIITEDEVKLYTASIGDVGSIKHEFIPDDGSLRILNGSDELPVLQLTDNGMLLLFVPAYNLSSGDTTAYLTRAEP